MRVGRHCVVVEVAAHDLPQPFPLFGDWLVHTPSHRLLDLPQLCPHAIPSGLPLDLEFARAGFAANEAEAQEVEGLRLTVPPQSVRTRSTGSSQDAVTAQTPPT